MPVDEQTKAAIISDFFKWAWENQGIPPSVFYEAALLPAPRGNISSIIAAYIKDGKGGETWTKLSLPSLVPVHVTVSWSETASYSGEFDTMVPAGLTRREQIEYLEDNVDDKSWLDKVRHAGTIQCEGVEHREVLDWDIAPADLEPEGTQEE